MSRFGAFPIGDGHVLFRVWAPNASTVAVEKGSDTAVSGARNLAPAQKPQNRCLTPQFGGVFEGHVPGGPGDDYLYVLDGDRALPDPCSRFQPAGIDRPSRVVDTSSYEVAPGPELALEELVVYELHVGAFSDEGTFDGVTPYLPALKALGVTAIELMPVGTFPGNRGWGYLDEHHETPWGGAIDYSQPAVREWAIQNAELWVRDFQVDGLRLDATFAIFDDSSPTHVLAELRDRLPDTLLIAEQQEGDIRPIQQWGFDAQSADAFHHELHVALTGERHGHYCAHDGSLASLAAEYERAPPERLVYCSQNHDQVGNRAAGDRPQPAELELRAAALLFAPQTPLLFMARSTASSARSCSSPTTSIPRSPTQHARGAGASSGSQARTSPTRRTR